MFPRCSFLCLPLFPSISFPLCLYNFISLNLLVSRLSWRRQKLVSISCSLPSLSVSSKYIYLVLLSVSLFLSLYLFHSLSFHLYLSLSIMAAAEIGFNNIMSPSLPPCFCYYWTLFGEAEYRETTRLPGTTPSRGIPEHFSTVLTDF